MLRVASDIPKDAFYVRVDTLSRRLTLAEDVAACVVRIVGECGLSVLGHVDRHERITSLPKDRLPRLIKSCAEGGVFLILAEQPHITLLCKWRPPEWFDDDPGGYRVGLGFGIGEAAGRGLAEKLLLIGADSKPFNRVGLKKLFHIRLRKRYHVIPLCLSI